MDIQPTNERTLTQHHQNIVNAFRMSQKIQSGLQQARTSTQTTPTQKKIQQLMKPPIIPITNNYISQNTEPEKVFQYSAYPQLQEFYVTVCDDLMDTMSLPLSPLKNLPNATTQMDSHRLPVLFDIIQQDTTIPQKLVKLFELIDVQSLRFTYKRRLISIMVKKANEFLEFANHKITADIVNQVVLNKWAMKQKQNDDLAVENENSAIIQAILEKNKKRPYDFQKLGRKRVQQSIRKKFIHQNRIEPRDHWSNVTGQETIDIRKEKSQLIAVQAVKQLGKTN